MKKYPVIIQEINTIIDTRLRHKGMLQYDLYKSNISDTQILHFVHADTMNTILFIKIIIMQETISLINYFCLTVN